MVRGVAGVGLAVVVALLLGAATPVRADELEDRKSALEQEIAQVQQSMEYLDSDIAETIGRLRIYQGRLPAAQQSLAEAEGKVQSAADDAAALAARVEAAQETRARITDEIRADEQEMDQTREVIGQIASEAYRNGGVPTDVTLLLGADNLEDLTRSMDLVNQALRSRTAAMTRMAEHNAANNDAETRLAAVEAEITRLRQKADEALVIEQTARDAAAEQKATVDELVADTSALSVQLQAQKPVIEAELAGVERAQQQVTAEIAERQRRQLEEARKAEEARRQAEQERLRAEAEAAAAAEESRLRVEAEAAAAAETARRAAEAAAANRPTPAPVQPAPVAPVAPVLPPVEPVEPAAPSAFALRSPVSAPITSGFGWRTTPIGTIDFNGTGGYTHTGLDYGAACGTPLYAPAAGEVWYADSDVLPGAGNRIVLDHGVVGGNALATNYYHLSSYTVSVGQRVSAGQLIGYTGTTGNSQGCHLHFETMLNGALVDPAGLL